MKQELLLARTIAADYFSELLKGYATPPDEPVFALVEAYPQQRIQPEQRQDLLRFAIFTPSMDLNPYTSGRIFHREGELRWERYQDLVHVVYTGYEEYRPAFQEEKKQPLNTTEKVLRDYFLFGKRLDKQELEHIGPAAQQGDFAEVRIPRLLRYPILPTLARAERLQLTTCEYIHPGTGILIAYRFQNLLPFRSLRREKLHESLRFCPS
jgi:hypothetical protein